MTKIDTILLDERTTDPDTPDSGKRRIYVKSDGLYEKDSSGTVTNTSTGGGSSLPVVDTTSIVKGSVDATKLMRIEVDGLTTATTRTATMPDEDITFGTDADAIHDNIAAEISVLTEKVTPVNGDHLIIEDSADSNNKKRVQVGNLPTGGGGEANTASNVGTAGVGIFKQKTGVDLEFKKINAGSTKVTVTDDTGNNEVDVDVAEANLTLDNLGGTLGVAKGGTARASHTAYALLAGGTTSTGAQQSLAGLGTSGQVLTSNGAVALPTFQAAGGGGGATVTSAEYTLNEGADYSTSSGTFVDVDATNLSLTITTHGNDVLVHFHGTILQNNSSIACHFNIDVDGSPHAADDGIILALISDTLEKSPIAFTVRITGLSAASHTFKLQWKSGATTTLYAGAGTTGADVHGQFWVEEIS